MPLSFAKLGTAFALFTRPLMGGTFPRWTVGFVLAGIPLAVSAVPLDIEEGEITGKGSHQVGILCSSQVACRMSEDAPRLQPLQKSISLKELTWPGERPLLDEAALRRNNAYEDSWSDLIRWVQAEGTDKERVARICESDPALKLSATFPLTESNLRCAGWWMEKRWYIRIAERRRLASANPKPTPAPKNPQLWSELRGKSFSDAFSQLDGIAGADLWRLGETVSRVGWGDCAFGGTMAALSARAEQFLPEPEATGLIEQMYAQASACLTAADDGWERLHLRMGLLRLMQGELRLAKASLEEAQTTSDPREEFRTLFWLGVVQDSLQDSSPFGAAVAGNATPKVRSDNAAWKLLIRRNPLSIHAIIAAHSMGMDPFESIQQGATHMVDRRLGEGWSEANLAAFVFELMVARRSAEALGQWSPFVARTVEIPTPAMALFFARAHSTAENHRQAIVTMSKYMKDKNEERMSREFLDLYFPRPFVSEILSNSGDIDPVLVLSLIRQESAFDIFARSPTDARGLMQLMPATGKLLGVHRPEDLFDPAVNVKAGVGYMRSLLRRYDGKVEQVLGAYNAGFGNLDRWLQRYPSANLLAFSDLIPFRETRNYVAVIMRNAYWYGRLLASENGPSAATLKKMSGEARWRSAIVNQLLRTAWGGSSSGGSLASLEGFYAPGKKAVVLPALK